MTPNQEVVLRALRRHRDMPQTVVEIAQYANLRLSTVRSALVGLRRADLVEEAGVATNGGKTYRERIAEPEAGA